MRGREDDLYEAALNHVVISGSGSLSMMQRALGIGFNRASAMIEHLQEDGVLGPPNSVGKREVLWTPTDLLSGQKNQHTPVAKG